jgi:hypothetical protein
MLARFGRAKSLLLKQIKLQNEWQMHASLRIAVVSKIFE